jgi:hypothetical protein
MDIVLTLIRKRVKKEFVAVDIYNRNREISVVKWLSLREDLGFLATIA